MIAEWFLNSAVGILFGSIWAWFWIIGRIYEHPEYYDPDRQPQWLRLVAGKPKNWAIFNNQAGIIPKTISVVGLIGSLALFSYYLIFRDGNSASEIALYSTSLVLFTLITYFLLIWLAERALKRLPSRTQNR